MNEDKQFVIKVEIKGVITPTVFFSYQVQINRSKALKLMSKGLSELKSVTEEELGKKK